MLSQQPVVELEPRLHGLQPPGLTIEPLAVAAQLGRHVVGLDAQLAQPRRQGVQRRVDPLGPLGQRLGGGHQPDRPGLARLGHQRLGGPAGGAAQGIQVAQAVALGGERLVLGLRGLDLLDLADLEHEQVEVSLTRTRSRAEVIELAPARPGTLVRLEVGRPELEMLGAAEGVEHL